MLSFKLPYIHKQHKQKNIKLFNLKQEYVYNSIFFFFYRYEN